MTEAPPAVARGRFKGFSPEALAAIQTRSITGSWELRKLLKVMTELSHFDEVNDAAIKKAKTRMMVCIFAAVFCFVIAFFLMAFTESLWSFLLPLAVGGAAAFFGINYSRLKKADLINDFRLCLQPGLRDVAQDLDPEKKIRVRMDLAGPVQSKQKSKQNLPPGRFVKVTETIFEDPWCEVRLPLVDGSTALLEFDVEWTKIERERRNGRGKIKSKTKWRKKCAASATLLPPAPASWNEAALRARLDPRKEKAQLLEKDGVTGARLQRHWVFKGADDPPPEAPPAREVVGLLLRLYSALARGSEASK
ncbi:hypothetical protein [Paludibaculum fermentans]|uniref:Uncharacterized protein n=1 Tax=Paludibaculum fermentans TaxID=1473598 RepID=A0A7S7SL38_PALFE|nr:hypothetical protein [Paludibaculum fermentans]QOY87685.1 hypothetical protein IRI77_33880 [Paludibaculum fermentans]